MRLHGFVAIGVLGFVAPPFASIGASNESAGTGNSIVTQVTELEQMWKPGMGAEERSYFVRAGELAGGLAEYEPTAAVTAALQLVSNVLDKRIDSSNLGEADFEIGSADLGAVEKAALFLLAEGNLPFGSPLEKSRVLARTLGAVRAELIPGYARRPVTMNVMPPLPAEGITVSGMDPDAIADPVAREAYKAAIRENQLNNLMNKRQDALHELESEFAARIVAYIARVASGGCVPYDIVRQAIIDARLTEAEQAVLVRRLPPG